MLKLAQPKNVFPVMDLKNGVHIHNEVMPDAPLLIAQWQRRGRITAGAKRRLEFILKMAASVLVGMGLGIAVMVGLGCEVMMGVILGCAIGTGIAVIVATSTGTRQPPRKVCVRFPAEDSNDLEPVDLYVAIKPSSSTPAQFYAEHTQSELAELMTVKTDRWRKLQAGAYATVMIVLVITVAIIIYLLAAGN